MRLKNLKYQILYCLQKYPESRNSDTKLTNLVWMSFYRKHIINVGNEDHPVYAVRLAELYELPTQDDIKRIRAKIQNIKHKFLPTEWKIAQQRKWNEEEYRKFLGYNPEMRTI